MAQSHNAVRNSHSFLDISPTVFAIDHADVTVVIGSMSRILPYKVRFCPRLASLAASPAS